MGKRRKFTNEFKLEAVKLAERGGTPGAPVARGAGLNRGGVRGSGLAPGTEGVTRRLLRLAASAREPASGTESGAGDPDQGRTPAQPQDLRAGAPSHPVAAGRNPPLSYSSGGP